MQRFRPTSQPNTLSDKANADLVNQRFMPPRTVVQSSGPKVELKIARTLGMDNDTRGALAQITALADKEKIGVAGRFMQDAGVSALLAKLGVAEKVEEADFFQYNRIVIPYGGVSPRLRRKWEEAGHRIEDLTSPFVRRAQVALGLLRMEGAQPLVIGRHEDAETLALSAGSPTTIVLETTTDTARLVFSPAFGVVCQTNLSNRRVAWLVQQLRHRYRDSRVTFLNTISPAMAAREDALEQLLVDCDLVVIVGEEGETSCEALLETAMRRGKPAMVVSSAAQVNAEMRSHRRIAFSAGAFATDETVRAVAMALVGK